MRIMITGATGFIGSHLVRDLLQRGCEIIACVRNTRGAEQKFPGINTLGLDYTANCDAAQLARQLGEIDVVINTVGIIAESGGQTFRQLHVEFPCCLFRACELAGVRRIIHLSALGADETAVSQYHLSKNEADRFLRTLSVETVIIKPGLVYGAGGTSTLFFQALSALPVQGLIGGGRQRIQPVFVDDLVDAIAGLATAEKAPVEELEAVGPASISFREMLAAYRQWLGYGALRAFPIPYSLALFSARLAGPLNAWLKPDNIRMLQQNNTGDAEAFRSVLGRTPLSLAAWLQRRPPSAPDRLHARLYFLLPLLRFAVAFVWVFSGLTSAFFFPVSESHALLARVGLTGGVADIALYGAALLDVVLGLAVLFSFRPLLTGIAQLAVIGGYTVAVTLFLPEFWLHPFGPIIKNIPFIVAILILMAVRRK